MGDGHDRLPDRTREAVDLAVEAVAAGDLVVYPTETVYGLGADALDPAAVDRVFELKRRDRTDPLSLGVASVAEAGRFTRASDRALAFMDEFLPGPVTVVVERGPGVPEVLTGGRDRVGVRVPDHPVALALLRETGPLTATSANRSGGGSVVRVDELDSRIRNGVAAVIEYGETAGVESTVVDPDTGVVHRRGAQAAAVDAWLADHPS